MRGTYFILMVLKVEHDLKKKYCAIRRVQLTHLNTTLHPQLTQPVYEKTGARNVLRTYCR